MTFSHTLHSPMPYWLPQLAVVCSHHWPKMLSNPQDALYFHLELAVFHHDLSIDLIDPFCTCQYWIWHNSCDKYFFLVSRDLFNRLERGILETSLSPFCISVGRSSQCSLMIIILTLLACQPYLMLLKQTLYIRGLC